MRRFELRRREIAPNGGKPLAQFLPVVTVPPVAKRAEPLIAVGLADGRARPNNFPALAPFVARGTDLIQSAKSRRQIVRLGQGALASSLTCAIDVKNDPGGSFAIHQTPSLLVRSEWATLEVIEKECAQGVNRRL